jgi:formylglycine-generating enzyme required for sulfatase activity
MQRSTSMPSMRLPTPPKSAGRESSRDSPTRAPNNSPHVECRTGCRSDHMTRPASNSSSPLAGHPRRVTLDPFLIARTECTRKAWAMAARATADGLPDDQFDESSQLPARGFSPAEADTWCDTAGLAPPTEAQWEFMRRAGTTTPWAMGADKADLAQFANVGSAECPESWIKMGITESWRDG